MSIVEKALQKAQAKPERVTPPERTAADVAARPSHEHPVPAPHAPGSLDAAGPCRTADGRECRGGNVTLDVAALRADGGSRRKAGATDRRGVSPHQVARAQRDHAREGVAPAVNNIVLVTSAIPGEGKTFNALNLALSIARERDLEVLLVDGDVAQPSLSASVGLAGTTGSRTCCAIRGSRRGRHVSRRTSRAVPAAGRRAARERAGAAVERAHGDRRRGPVAAHDDPGVVVIDSPPILATNEAQVLTAVRRGRCCSSVARFNRAARSHRSAESDRPQSSPWSAILKPDRAVTREPYYNHYYYGYGKGPSELKAACDHA
jgi:receptor protein-tyrosine kinase